MSNAEKGQIDQLWYTWSTRGLDAIPAGFRVRAASSGLTDIYGKRVEQLSRYLRYSLPPGTDALKTSPEEAPVCLAYVRTEDGERALVHKVYTGRDGRNRPGAYFAHMLAGLDDFTPKNAIALWHADLWAKKADSNEPTLLELTTLQAIKGKYAPRSLEIQFNKFINFPGGATIDIDESGIHNYLAFVVHAYLLQHRRNEQRQQLQNDLLVLKEKLEDARGARWNRSGINPKDIELEINQKEAELRLLPPIRIVIAAPPDTVAYLIAALIRVMPDYSLANITFSTKNITFSTYENDVLTKYPLDIVGICLPPKVFKPANEAQDILPASIYKTNLALNTYQSSQSILETIKLNDHRISSRLSIVEDYARDAASAIKENDWQELDEFLQDVAKEAKKRELKYEPLLTVVDFLELYYFNVIVVRWLPRSTLNNFFEDYDLARVMLNKHRVRKQIFERIYRDDPQLADLDEVERAKRETREQHLAWLGQELPPLAANLRMRAVSKSALVAQKDTESVEGGLDQIAADAVQHLINRAELDDSPFFNAIHNLLCATSPQQQGSQTWINLLQHLQEGTLQQFALKHWDANAPEQNVCDLLLEDTCAILTPGNQEHDEIVDQLLKVTSVADFARLLDLSRKTPKPYSLEYPALRLPVEWNYRATRYFLDAIDKNHGSIEPLLKQQIITQLESSVDQLTQLTKQSLKTGQPDYKTMAQNLFAALVDYGYRYKLHMLYAWLDLLLNANDLKTIFGIAQLSREEEAQPVLRDYYAAYIQKDDTAHVFEKLLKEITRHLAPEKKLEIIDKTLENILPKERGKEIPHITKKRVERFFDAAQLTTDERIHIIEQYSARLLLSSILHELVSSLYADVIKAPEGSSHRIRLLYHILDTRRSDAIVDALLTLANLTDNEALEFFHRYHQGFPFCYHAPTARKLYRRLLLSYPGLKNYLLHFWLPSHDMTPGEIDELLGAIEANLTPEEITDLLETHGEWLLRGNRHAQVLHSLIISYLQNFPRHAFQNGSPAQRFLSFLATIIQDLPADTHETLKNWSTIWAFLRGPSCQQSRILAIARIIQSQGLPMHALQSLLEPLAGAFASCCHNALQFCFVIATICNIGDDDTAKLLEHMTVRIRADLALDYGPQRASEYLHFLLSDDTADMFSDEINNRLITLLLQHVDRALFAFIDQQAADWSPAIRFRWLNIKRQYGYQPIPPSEPKPPKPAPAPLPSTSTSTARDGFIAAWRRFPAQYKQLKQIMTRRGIGERAAFGIENSSTLVTLKKLRLLNPQWLAELTFACRLYDLLQVADTSMQLATEQDIIRLVDVLKESFDETKWTTHERVRIRIARRIVGRSLTASPPSITPPAQHTSQSTGPGSERAAIAPAGPAQQPPLQTSMGPVGRDKLQPIILPNLGKKKNK